MGVLLSEDNHETVYINKNEMKELSKLSGDGLYYITVSNEIQRQYFTAIGTTAEKVFTDSWFAKNVSFAVSSDGIISISQIGWAFSVRFDIYKVS